MKLYWTYRPERIGNVNLWDISLNWTYTPSFYLNNQFRDWNEAWLTNVIDLQIPEERYTAEISSWIPKLTRFISCEYDETKVDPIELARSLENVWARFDIDILTIEEARQWIRDNTNLQEVETWKFIINEETEFDWEIIPAQYLIIE